MTDTPDPSPRRRRHPTSTPRTKQIPTTVILAIATMTMLAASACSSSDETSIETATPTVASVLDTGPTTSFNVPQVTAATVPTTDPNDTTTDAPTTTAPPVAGSVEEAVANAAIETREAYLYAVYNVEAPDALDRLLASHLAGSTALDVGLENYQSIVDNGWRVRPNPVVPSSLTPESIELLDVTTAEVVVCVVSAGVVFAPGAAADGGDVIINNEIEAGRDRIVMVLDEGTWKLKEGTNLETWKGVTSCPAS
jgi:hypothetical protein